MVFSVIWLPLLVSSVLGAVVRQEGAFCPLFCNTEPDNYVCGTDNVSYQNHCYFHKAQCKNPGLQKLHDGACASIQNRGIVCTTPICMDVYEPVCGSDGTTYSNMCFLNNAKCLDESLKMEWHGPCTQAIFE